MKRRPRPRLMMLVLLLTAWGAAGAIINIAVAWGCAQNDARAGHGTYAFDNRTDEQRFWETFAHGSAMSAAEVVTVVVQRTFGHAIFTARARLPSIFVPVPDRTLGMGYTGPPIPEGATSVEVTQHAYIAIRESGWPMRSLRQTQLGAPGISESGGSWQWRSTAPPIPLSPIWPGFAINTVFYAVVLWLLFASPFALRRRRRIQRGLCPKCAYPVGTNEHCTECGAMHASPSR